MSQNVLGTCCDDEIEIIHYEEKYCDRSMNVLRKSFFLHEAVCIGSEVNLDSQAQKDLEQLCLDVGRSGVSLLARHKSSGEIVGVSFNVLQTPSAPGDANYFESFRDHQCKSASSKSLMQYMITMDAKVDLFQMFNVDCLLEIMFLATLPAFEGKGIASNLVACSIDLAKQLKHGHGIENLPKDSKHKRPELVSALFTSRVSQKVGTKNKFTEINEVPHAEFIFRGKTYSDRIGPDHPTSILMAREI
ncbi:uncharacterized protein LOC131683619 [Topomyia yanbarensis]|uniref:uncharacterized protein LOC131683619 n=1 Tax=Topomyia yanbarensis TaxID=2498891 RepID=UPI00273ADC06|nr:uncharacterized protein LOC131683619 [Topomyia yanbarensis]